jgi:hypothetical protein
MARNRRKIQSEKKTKNAGSPQLGTGIRCPICNSTTRVVRTDARPDESIHGRYRTCTNDKCGHRVYTEEAITVNDVDKLIIENRKKRLAAMKKAKEIIENPEKLKKPVRKQMVRERMNRKQTVRKRKTI